MWLVGVVVRRYIDFLIILLIPTPLVLALLLLIPTSLFILKMFFRLLCNIANVAQRIFDIVQKSRSREHGDIIINYRECTCARESRDFFPMRVHAIMQRIPR